MNRYKPGQGVRALNTVTMLGMLTNPPTPVITIEFPDGTTVTPASVTDSVGMLHADFVIPSTMVQGIGVERWVSTGLLPSQNATKERLFEIEALDF